MAKFTVRDGFAIRVGEKVLGEGGDEVELTAKQAIGCAHMLEGIGPDELEELKVEAGVASTDGQDDKAEKKGKGGKPAKPAESK